MWAALFAEGSVFDASGAGARWRPSTRAKLQKQYGYWLFFIKETDVDLLKVPPTVRVTQARVRTYYQSMSDKSPVTSSIRVNSLYRVLRRVETDIDWRWLGDMTRALEKAVGRGGDRKKGRIVPSSVLYEAGIRLLEKARAAPNISEFSQATMHRDGLMLALLASRPLRLKNFAAIQINTHLERRGDTCWINFSGEETKTGRPIQTFVPEELSPWLEQYLRVHRPVLLGNCAHHDLWINRFRRPFSQGALSGRISKLTEGLIGVRVNPHLFRDCAATTIATADPLHVGIIAPLLGNAPHTAERHYNHARTLEAGRDHQRVIRTLRNELRPVRRRVRAKGRT